MAEFLFTPVPHGEAIAFIRDKPAVSRAVFDRLLPELKARAFTISGIEVATVLQDVRDRIAEVPAGADWDTIKYEIADEIGPYLEAGTGDTEEERRQQAREIQAAAERRAEILLRTHGFEAYQAARHEVMERQTDVMPMWQYQSVGDNRVRPAHAALDGVVLPAGHPFWQTHFPPWDWGCRCQVVPLSEADIAEIRDQDADNPPERQRIVEGVRLERLERDGKLALGPGQDIDVRAPIERATTPEERQGAFSWNPGDLRVSVEQLKERYDPEVFGQFERWARSERIEERGQTVWEWLGGGQAEPEPAPVLGSSGPVAAVAPSTRRLLREESVAVERSRSDVGARSSASEVRPVVLRDGTRAMDKPLDHLYYAERHRGEPRWWTDSAETNGAPLQIAADDLSRGFGLDAVAPSAITRDGLNLRTRFIDGTVLAEAGPAEVAAIPRPALERAAFIDYIVGQRDGHGGQYMVTSDRRLVGFDYNIAGGEEIRSFALRAISRSRTGGGYVAEFGPDLVGSVRQGLASLQFRDEVPDDLQEQLRGRLRRFVRARGVIRWKPM